MTGPHLAEREEGFVDRAGLFEHAVGGLCVLHALAARLHTARHILRIPLTKDSLWGNCSNLCKTMKIECNATELSTQWLGVLQRYTSSPLSL
jgi:hypothetical protein